MNGIEPTWEDIHQLVYYIELGKKDTSFTGKDIIRFFIHNLSILEQEEVIEYFEQFCLESIPPTDPLPQIPHVPILIPPPVYIPPELPPPPNIPQLPPPPIYPNFLLPVWPFIVPHLLPQDILDHLLNKLGVTKAHAQELQGYKNKINELKIKIDKKQKLINSIVKKHPWPPRSDIIDRIIDKNTQIDEEIPSIPDVEEEEIEEDVFEEDWTSHDEYWDDTIPEGERHMFYIEDALDSYGPDLVYMGWWRYTGDKDVWYQFKYIDHRFEVLGQDLWMIESVINDIIRIYF